MSFIDQNEYLWEDKFFCYKYQKISFKLGKIYLKEKKFPSDILEIVNDFRVLKEYYEEKIGEIQDPTFYFSYSQVNSLLLMTEAKPEELRSHPRNALVIDNLKIGLMKHLLYPTYDESLLKLISHSFYAFANENDLNWFKMNSEKFIPPNNNNSQE